MRDVRLKALVALAVAGGCSDVLGLDEVTADGPHDVCFAGQPGGLVQTCIVSSRLAERRTIAELDTGTDGSTGDCDIVQAQPSGGPDVCVVAARALTVGATIAHGARPLVLVGDTIEIIGMISVASVHGSSAGAGSEPSDCEIGSITGTTSSVGGAGAGAGGSLHGKGGNGGNGMPGPLSGGIANAPVGVAYLRGGCAGGDGGDALPVASAGVRGAGGGAVYVLASTSIAVRAGAVLNASGSGGTGGIANLITGGGGGGGGGSGGMIVLDAPHILLGLGARISANGGGGGGGAGFGKTGTDGADPDVQGDTSPPYTAPGGIRTGTAGGFGGAGGAGSSPARDGTSGNGNGGGGGGGGGVGFVGLLGDVVDRGAIITPAPGL